MVNTEPNPFEPPYARFERAAWDPERAQRFANRLTVLGLAALASAVGSIAAVDGFARLTYGRGSQVGAFGWLVVFSMAALAVVLMTQQLGPTLKSRGRIVAILVVSTITAPLLAALYHLG